MKRFLKNLDSFGPLLLLLFVLLFIGGCNFYWTKRSLENVAGKPVAWYTVFYAMWR